MGFRAALFGLLVVGSALEADAASAPGATAPTPESVVAASAPAALADLDPLNDAVVAPPELVRTAGIGTRVRMVFTPIAPGLALPQWTIDETAQQPSRPWRYPE